MERKIKFFGMIIKKRMQQHHERKEKQRISCYA